MPVGFPAKTDFAAGAVLTAAQMNDITGTLNLVAGAQGQIAGKNAVINGSFDFWQRGTSFSNPTNGQYVADRWNVQMDGTGATTTVSRQTVTPGTFSGFNPDFFLRWDVSAAGTATYRILQQRIENVNTYAAQTVTLSFYARATTNRTITPYWQQNFGSGGSADTFTNFANVNITSTWTRYSVSVAVPSVSGKTIGSSSYGAINIPISAATGQFEITGVQVELGSQVSAFSRAAGTLQGELAACQRYLQVLGNDVSTGSPTGRLGTAGLVATTTLAYVPFTMPVQMRSAPSLVTSSLTGYLIWDGTNSPTLSALTLETAASNTRSVTLVATASAATLTVGRSVQIYANFTPASPVFLNAEL